VKIARLTRRTMRSSWATINAVSRGEVSCGCRIGSYRGAAAFQVSQAVKFPDMNDLVERANL
jgi:hypothetical protein